MFALEIKGMEREGCLEEDDSDMIEYEWSETPHISLNALSGVPTHNTMRVKGYCSEGNDSSLNEKLNQLLEEYADVLTVPKELPPYRSFDHKIPLKTGNVSINIRPYRYPPTQKNTIETMIKELLDSRIVRPSDSPFSSPIVLVKKKDGSWRMCINYRHLNKNTVKYKFPILVIKELIDELHGAMVFSKLNLRSGYHQIRMCEEDIYKTDFKSHEGYYEFVVMDFGLTNAPSTFQALMNSVFKPFRRKFTLVFFNDILVYTQGVSADPSKITAMQDWPVPTTLKHLWGFLGLTCYYKRFIKALPIFTKGFILETDASGIGIGARGYLLDRHFKIRTDHFNLKYMLDQRITTLFQSKWLPKLLGFDYDIEYKKGVDNAAAVALSRIKRKTEDQYWPDKQINKDYIPHSLCSFSYCYTLRLLSVTITLSNKAEDPDLSSQQVVSELGTTSDGTGKKKGRTVTVTTEDMQKRKNDYKTAQQLWAAILKTFGGNEATKKTKKNLLKQQYGNFKAKGSETLEQTFNRLQVIVSQLQFIDVEIDQDDLNQKFLTILALKWLMHMIVCRNRSDLDTMSLDDLYNHLKVYESEVQKKSEPNSQNMAFISSAKHSRGNKKVNTASVSTASTNVPTTSANIGVVSISQDTACAYIASQSNGSQIKFEDINQIDEDDMEEMDIKWNMALLSMRADRAPRNQERGRRDNYKQGSKDEEQAPKALMAIDGVGWDWSYMANDEENHALIADEETPTEFALMAKTSTESEVFDNSLCSKDCKKNSDSLNNKITDLTDKLFDAKNMIYHYKLGLAQVESRLAEQRDQEIKYCEKIKGLEFKTESSNDYIESLKKELKLIKKEKEELETKLTGFQTASKDIDSLLESKRLDKNKEGLGYNAVPPPPAQIYSPLKKDMSWTGLPEFKDDTVTDYSRPSPPIESTSDDAQNKNPSVTETEASPSTFSPNPFIKFVKAHDSPTKSKTEKSKKSSIKYVEQYKKPINKPNVRGNQRNWNNLKSHQLGSNFVMKKKVCFNYGDFNHLFYNCSKRVKNGTPRSQNNTHKSFTPRSVVHRPNRPLMRPMRPNMNVARPNRTSFNKPAHSYTKRPFQRSSALRFQSRAPWVPTVNRKFPTVNRKFPTANRKFPTGSTKFSTADMGMKGNDVKASASQNNIDDKGYWDSGYSRHMTDNISYLCDYEPFDGGYVSFGQGGCKITSKGTIKTS
uniref:Reverse transcriptase domain-containing protein n=1 Tax=Tanacetum cinerariifolium TaxID=118510 RepID=A0A6L2NBH5_TANCI|nr:hypothetical protein [Tanacetum cinerariifolium]